jgi:TonB-dependent starch-binding outer membrane protein SusC
MKSTQKSKAFLNRLGLISLLVFIGSITMVTGQFRVTGIVTDENQSPLPGANVRIENTTIGATTDINGKYSVNAPSGEANIVFSYLGYETLTQPIDNRSEINMTLYPELALLSEFVVVGYGTQRKSDLTGSVVKVSSEDMQSTPIVNVGDALKGRAAGVLVTSNSGQPGSAPTIRIRGESSIRAGNDPLIIIDGMPGGNLATLNMNDVESFEILKDAAAASIYGSAGANGVILITTKRGKAGENLIEFSSKIGTRHFPEFHDVLNSQQMYGYLKETLPTLHNFSDEYFVDWDAITLSTIDTTNFANTDWQDEMFDVGLFQDYSLSFSSGTDKLTYRLSGSYLNDVGVIKPANLDRYTLRINVDNQITPRIKITTDAFLAHTDRIRVNDAGLGWNGGMVNAALQHPPFIPIYDDATGYMFPNPIRPQVDSPFALANGVSSKSKNTNATGSFKIDIELFKGLKFRSEWFADISVGESRTFRDRNNTYDGRVYNGRGNGSNTINNGLTFHNILQYDTKISNHELFVMAGQIAERSNSSGLGVSVIDYPSDYIVLLQQANNFESMNDGRGEFRKYSFIGRVNYSYKGKYLAQINMRADGSPIFGPDNRWGYFPSGSVGWKISEEPFMAAAENIDLLKLRFGIGNTGNDQIPSWQWMSTYGSGARSRYDIYGTDMPAAFYSPSRMVNPQLRWESTLDYSLGMDLSAYRGRIDLSLDFYIRNSYNLLYNKPLPNTSGFGGIFYNLGEVKNQGVELVFTTHNIDRPDFNWKTNFNFSYNENEVISIGGNNEATYGRWSIAEGMPINTAWLFEMDRIFQIEDFDLVNGSYVLKPEFANQLNVQPGDIKFTNFTDVDMDGDGEADAFIDNNDRVFMGSGTAPWIYGMTNTFSWKGLSLSFFLQGVYGNKIYNETRVYSEGMNDYFNQFSTILDRWTPTNPSTTMPRATLTDLNANTRESSRWLEDGWYLRVKDITLSYRIPDRFSRTVQMKGATFYVTGQNWITFTDYTGYDPEVGRNDNGTYPQVKTVIFGVNLSI